MSMRPKLKLVRQYILKQFGKQIVLKDLQNVRTKAKLESKGKRDEAQISIDRLEEEIQSDKGSKGGVIVNEANELSIFYFASSHLLRLYEKFPEVIMIDGTYNVNASRMPLYSFTIEDGNGHGRTVFMLPQQMKAHSTYQLLFKDLSNATQVIATQKLSSSTKILLNYLYSERNFPTQQSCFVSSMSSNVFINC